MTGFPTSLRQSARLGAVALMTALAFTGAAAQSGHTPHPTHIHAGTCDALGDVVAPLGDVADSAGDRSGPESALPVEMIETVVDIPLQTIIDGGHAVNVHKSADEIDVYIACGDIGGVVNPGEGAYASELVIGLGELNDSGYTGVAWFGADGDKTHVAVMLVGPAEADMASAASTQDAAPVAADAMAVEIKGFAFNPPTMTVPVGGSVTWTNQDNAPHTATGMDRAALQSGALKFGDSYTQTFDTAGSYDYFCEFHANMKGTVVVE